MRIDVLKVSKTKKTLVNVAIALAKLSKIDWYNSEYFFWVDCEGKAHFELDKGYKLCEASYIQLKSEENSWKNYKIDIRDIATNFPEFEFYLMFEDKVLYAHKNTFHQKTIKDLLCERKT